MQYLSISSIILLTICSVKFANMQTTTNLIEIGSKINLSCYSDQLAKSVPSNQIIKYIWSKENGRPMINSDHLAISDIQYSDSGVYVCTIIYKEGRKKKSMKFVHEIKVFRQSKNDSCPFGFKEENDLCYACQPGEFSEFKGSEQCFLCPPDTYNENFTAGNCTACPLGTYTWWGGSKTSQNCIDYLLLTILVKTPLRPFNLKQAILILHFVISFILIFIISIFALCYKSRRKILKMKKLFKKRNLKERDTTDYNKLSTESSKDVDQKFSDHSMKATTEKIPEASRKARKIHKKWKRILKKKSEKMIQTEEIVSKEKLMQIEGLDSSYVF